jgi:hypothetical protein
MPEILYHVEIYTTYISTSQSNIIIISIYNVFGGNASYISAQIVYVSDCTLHNLVPLFRNCFMDFEYYVKSDRYEVLLQ